MINKLSEAKTRMGSTTKLSRPHRVAMHSLTRWQEDLYVSCRQTSCDLLRDTLLPSCFTYHLTIVSGGNDHNMCSPTLWASSGPWVMSYKSTCERSFYSCRVQLSLWNGALWVLLSSSPPRLALSLSLSSPTRMGCIFLPADLQIFSNPLT